MRSDRLSGSLAIIGLSVLFASDSLANEALDYLEGKLSEDEVTVTDLIKEKEKVEAAEEARKQERILRDDRDYRNRWKNRLVPKGLVYDNESNPIVQRVAIDGLAEWGTVNGEINSDEGIDINDNQLKRVRLGGMIRAFYNTDLEGRVVGDGNGYQGIDTLKATVQVTEGIAIETGKFRAPFGQEYRQDPNVRSAPGLSPIVAQIAPSNTLGVRVGATNGNWEMGLGWFSGDQDRNIPGIDGGGFVLANVAYSFDGEVVAGPDDEDAVAPAGHQRWYLDYIYNTSPSEGGSIPNEYRHLLSTGIEVSSGRLDFAGDFLLANGGVNTAWGLNMTGRYWLLEDAIRLVGRYNFADSNEPGGVSVGYGVPGAVGDATQPLAGFSTVLSGDEFHSFYLGLDWHVLQDYLLFSTGVEYRLLKDEINGDSSGVLWHTGGRVAF